MDLKKYINECYNGSVLAFSKASGLRRQQTDRYIEMGCVINTITGEITRNEVKFVCAWGEK